MKKMLTLSLVTMFFLSMISLNPAFAGNRVWEYSDEMPSPLVGFGMVNVNGDIYFFGGQTTTTVTNKVEVYNPTSNTRIAKSNMPTARAGFSTVTLNNKIYTFGGFSGNAATYDGGPLNTVEVYDLATDTWASKATMPSARGWATAAVYNGKIYVFGGLVSKSEEASNTVFVYDPTTDTWANKANMPVIQYAPSSVVVNNKIYIVGGSTGASRVQNTLWEYTPENDTWIKKAGMATARCAVAAVYWDGVIYAIGGATSSSGTNVVEMYDISSDTWKSAPSMNDSRWGHASTVIGGKLSVFGGGTQFNAISKSVEILTIEDPSTPIYDGRALLTIYISGGQIKEYDLSAAELNAFITWYDTKDAGTGPAKYKFIKTWNKGPFKARTEYVIFDKILTFDVDEYDAVNP
ncbi:Kelch repeat-containing protein [Cohnella abietis]|uniref:Uncharacterized protein n=1 Tax=Cohnella abietis TaxID=2507935 RepID=A0A3T1D3H1_9BACL|nr:kelch repeat-containing protein [Cohnella abietis]BBI32662.1 hypothetical protein KCTCHS21_20610 [Cohnella abietis]